MTIREDIEKRAKWIKQVLKDAGANGIIYGNSGGKDCTLVGAIAKMATDNVLGVIMPCESKRNYEMDKDDAYILAKHYNIETIVIDLTPTKMELKKALGDVAGEKVPMSLHNINPRLRMTTLYAIAQEKNYLVAGTGNLSETTMGYFTKWGDGASDFNPIADLTATEVFNYLRELDAPDFIITKAPSAALFEGQTDELDMGVTYDELDTYIRSGKISSADKKQIIDKAYARTGHKRELPIRYNDGKK